jgi:hypothetical protein
VKIKPKGKRATSPPKASSDLRGWSAIAQFLGMPNSTVHRWAKERDASFVAKAETWLRTRKN